ncbi:MAG: hypothetical protein HOI39_04085, partial [Flavobacteriales bacterium]|nr:hypothetical protein [Flavobacteriales bacterium]
QNKKWIGTKKGIVTITDDGWVLFNKRNTPLKTNIIKSIVCDGYDRVWVSTEKGVISYEGDSWRKYRLKKQRSLIINLFVDAFDNKWIHTSNNIIVFNDEGVEFKNNITNENSVVVSK